MTGEHQLVMAREGEGRSRRRAPEARGHFLLGSLPELRRPDRLRFLSELMREHGDIVRLQLGPKLVHVIRAPEDVGYVLKSNHRNYSKLTEITLQLRALLGEGLLTSDGDLWRRQRRIAQPAFHQHRVAQFTERMGAAATECVLALAPAAERGTSVDVATEMMRLTLRIVTETLFGTDMSRTTEELNTHMDFLRDYATSRAMSLLPLPAWAPTPKNLRFRATRARLDQIVLEIIRERRAQSETSDDLLGMLMQARDATTGEAMSDRQLRDEVMTLFLAGHETTASALTWSFYLLSKFPWAQRKLKAEVESVLSGRAPTVSDLPRLVFTTMVFQEAMRIYPPAWAFARVALADDEIRGFHVPKGSLIFISPYLTHRHPEFWPNPEGFDPERFHPDRLSSVPRFAYFPFGGGPRLCIGHHLAMMEGQIILATWAQRYRFDLVPDHPIEVESLIALRPKHGLMMTLHPTESSSGATPSQE